MEEDLAYIPQWLSDETEIAPCPCGQAMFGPIAVVKSDRGFRTGYHPPCLWRRKYHEETDDDVQWEDGSE